MDRAAWLAITSSAIPRMICIGSRTYNQHSTGGQADDPEGVPRGGRGPGSPPCFHTRLITRQQVYVGNKESEMRTFILAFAATGLLIAQKPQVPLLEVLIGQLIAVSGDRIEVGDADGTHVLYSDAASAIWRGKDYHDFSVLRPGDEVAIAYRNDAQSRAVVIDLSANIDKVEGRITRVGRDGFQVDETITRRRIRATAADCAKSFTIPARRGPTAWQRT